LGFGVYGAFLEGGERLVGVPFVEAKEDVIGDWLGVC